MLIYIRDYQESYKIGDIVEVRPDGYWTVDHGYNQKAFKLLTKVGLPVDESLIASEGGNDRRQDNNPEYNGTENRKVVRRKETRPFKRRRYNIKEMDDKLPISKDNIGTDIIEKEAYLRKG